MFVEYIKLLGSGIQPEFPFDYILPMALILMLVVAIVFIGYKLKEELGAIVAIFICGLFFLYMNDLLRIVDAYTLSSPSKQTVPKSTSYSNFSSRAPKKAKIKAVEKRKLNSTQDSALSEKYSVYIHYSREENKKQVEEFAIFLKNYGFKVEGVERIN